MREESSFPREYLLVSKFHQYYRLDGEMFFLIFGSKVFQVNLKICTMIHQN